MRQNGRPCVGHARHRQARRRHENGATSVCRGRSSQSELPSGQLKRRRWQILAARGSPREVTKRMNYTITRRRSARGPGLGTCPAAELPSPPRHVWVFMIILPFCTQNGLGLGDVRHPSIGDNSCCKTSCERRGSPLSNNATSQLRGDIRHDACALRFPSGYSSCRMANIPHGAACMPVSVRRTAAVLGRRRMPHFAASLSPEYLLGSLAPVPPPAPSCACPRVDCAR